MCGHNNFIGIQYYLKADMEDIDFLDQIGLVGHDELDEGWKGNVTY